MGIGGVQEDMMFIDVAFKFMKIVIFRESWKHKKETVGIEVAVIFKYFNSKRNKIFGEIAKR